MAACVCGAEIRWGVREDTRERLPLEYHAELGPGQDRFIVTGNTVGGHGNSSHVVVPVAEGFEGEAYKDHRIDCPDHGNGLPTGR